MIGNGDDDEIFTSDFPRNFYMAYGVQSGLLTSPQGTAAIRGAAENVVIEILVYLRAHARRVVGSAVYVRT